MNSSLRINCHDDPTSLLAMGRDWIALSDSPVPKYAASLNFAQSAASKRSTQPLPMTCERNFVWALSTLSLIPESQRKVRIFTAMRGNEVVGILPLCAYVERDQEYWEILGSRGVLGDGKGIIARPSDQIEVGNAFAHFLSEEWIEATRLNLHGIWKDDRGMRAFCERFSESVLWACEVTPHPPGRLVHRISQGPDGNPIWPLATRRRLNFVHKALESGLFKTVFSTQKEDILQNAMALRNMLKNDAPALKSQFGPVSRTQRFLDYRFGQGIAPDMCQSGTLRSCLLHYKSKPIAGALLWDIHQSRRVVWLESKATGEQAQLVFWMILSQLIEESHKHDLQDIHLDLSWQPWTAIIPNLASTTWNAELKFKETERNVSTSSQSNERRQIQQ